MVVDRCVSEGTANNATHSLRIRLAAHLEGIEAAREAAAVAAEEFPDEKLLVDFKSKLDRGENLWVTSFHYQDHPLAPNSSALAAAGGTGNGMIIRLRDLAHARTLGERLIAGPDAAAVAEVTALLAKEPDFAYAQLLAVRAGVWAGEEAELASVPAAFERALREEDAQIFARLAERAPKLEALTLVARALFGDFDAQDRIADWLAEAARDEPGPVADMRPRLRVILGGATSVDDVAAGLSAQRERVLTVLRRVNEALIDSDLIAA